MFYSFPQLALAFESDLGWLKSDIYPALTLGLLFAALAAIPVGADIDKGHGRTIMTGGSVLSGMLLIVCSQVESLLAFYFIFAGIGLLHATTLYDAAFSIIAKYYDSDSAKKNITTLTLWGGFASTLFIPLNELILHYSNWQTLVTLLGLINILICGGIYSQLPQDNTLSEIKSRKKNTFTDLKWATQQPIFWSLLICFSLFAAAATSFKFHLYPILVEKDFSTQDVVILMALVGPSQVAGRLILWVLGARVSIHTLGAVIASLLPVVFIAVVLLPIQLIFFVPFVVAFGMASGTMTIVTGVAVLELLSKEAYGVINGAMSFPINVIKALAPTLAAWLWAVNRDYDLLLMVLIVIGSAAALAFVFSIWSTRKNSREGLI